MQNFLKMIETVDRQGGVNYFDFSHALEATRANSPKTGWRVSETLSEMFYSHAKLNNPFVFSISTDQPLDPDLSDKAALDGQAIKLEKLDAPFKVFSIEMLEGSITVPRPGEQPIYTDCLMVVEGKTESNKVRYYVFALTRNEAANDPLNRFFVSVECAFDTSDLRPEGTTAPFNKPDTRPIVMQMSSGETMLPNAVFMNVIRHFIDRLDVEASGAERVNHKVRIGKGSSRELVKIRRVIHVSPKKTERVYAKTLGKEIEWSHRWFSRGHWRYSTLASPIILGKDREGVYCEVGRTWVTESVKGPEHKDLVHKVRVVDQNGTKVSSVSDR